MHELIIKNDFLYRDEVVDLYTKTAILNFISSLIELNVDNEFEEVSNICNLLVKYSTERKCKKGA